MFVVLLNQNVNVMFVLVNSWQSYGFFLITISEKGKIIRLIRIYLKKK